MSFVLLFIQHSKNVLLIPFSIHNKNFQPSFFYCSIIDSFDSYERAYFRIRLPYKDIYHLWIKIDDKTCLDACNAYHMTLFEEWGEGGR